MKQIKKIYKKIKNRYCGKRFPMLEYVYRKRKRFLQKCRIYMMTIEGRMK